MAKIWRNRIIGGTRTFEEVPLTWKAQVKELLRQDVANGTYTYAGPATPEWYEEVVGEPYVAPEA